jgi:hypothetical protein
MGITPRGVVRKCNLISFLRQSMVIAISPCANLALFIAFPKRALANSFVDYSVSIHGNVCTASVEVISFDDGKLSIELRLAHLRRVHVRDYVTFKWEFPVWPQSRPLRGSCSFNVTCLVCPSFTTPVASITALTTQPEYDLDERQTQPSWRVLAPSFASNPLPSGEDLSVGGMFYVWAIEEDGRANITVRLQDCSGEWAGPMEPPS